MHGDEEAEQDYDARTWDMSEWVRQMSAAPGACDFTFEIGTAERNGYFTKRT